MKAIAAVDENWGIGYENRLLYIIPEDQEFFLDKTEGHTVIMGRKTLESLPDGKPLKDRKNIVLSGNTEYEADGALTVHSVEELLKAIEGIPNEDLFVIGGAMIYRLLLKYCDVCWITKIYDSAAADAYFPDLEKEEGWKIVKRSGIKSYNGLKYEFMKWEKEQK